MRIEKIRVQNYRGIKNTEWLKFEELNAIVGRNDAGKSSILHALNTFFYDAKLVEEDRYFGAGQEDTLIEVIFDGDELQNVPSIILDNEAKLHVKKYASQVGESFKNSIIVKDFGNSKYKNILQLTNAKYPPLFKSLEMEVPEVIDKNSIYSLIDELLNVETEFAMEEHEIKSTLLKNILKEIYPQYSLFLADTNLDTGASTFQNQFKKIISNAIEAHIEEFSNLQGEVTNTLNDEIKKIGEYMVSHYPNLCELRPDINYDWAKLVNFEVIMKDSSQYEVNLSHKGSGVQRLFMVSYFQYLAEQSRNDNGSCIFALEEPETFLHPGAQRTLLESLKKIAEYHQVIITTHSPVFASEINNKNIIIATKTNTESIYKQGDAISSEALVEELGIRASDSIVNSKLLVFVEGSNDVRFWDIIYKKVTGHKFEEDEILFLPGGGDELHNIAEMNLMHKLNRNFMVIVDGDKGAVDYADKVAKQAKLKTVVEAKGGEVIVLRKREIENYYCPRILEELLNRKGVAVSGLTIAPYEDVNKKIKTIVNGKNVQMKFKNNMDIFEAMTLDDWKQVSLYEENGANKFELGEIVSQIVSKIDVR